MSDTNNDNDLIDLFELPDSDLVISDTHIDNIKSEKTPYIKYQTKEITWDEYRDIIAVSKGFKDRNEHFDFLARQRGYKDFAEYKNTKSKVRRAKNPEKHRRYSLKHYRKNRKKYIEKNREWRENNKDKLTKYRDDNRERFNESSVERWKNNRLKVITHYSNNTMQCNDCKDNHYEFLTVDHIDGGGKKHREEIGGGHLVSWLIRNNFPEGFQVLCYNCNLSKGYKNNASNNNVSRRALIKRKNRKLVLQYYSNSEIPYCICCGETRYYYLSIDHIDGIGMKLREEMGDIVTWLIDNNFPSGYRVLCHNCNSSLGAYGFCPHHPEGVPIPVIIKDEDTYNKIDESIFAWGKLKW